MLKEVELNHKRRVHEEMKRKRKPFFRNVWVRKSEVLVRVERSSNQEGSSRVQAILVKQFQKRGSRFVCSLKGGSMEPIALSST